MARGQLLGARSAVIPAHVDALGDTMKVIRKPLFLSFFILLTAALLTGFSSEPSQSSFSREDLDIQANMVFFYYEDIEEPSDFYQNVLGLELVLDYGSAKAYRISQTSYVCLVDEKSGMHDASESKTVTLAFLTEELEAWYAYLQEQGVEMRSPLKPPSDNTFRGFVALDPGGYFLEFETFSDHPQNTKLLNRLRTTKASNRRSSAL